MSLRIAPIAAVIALALSACGGSDTPAPATTPAAEPAPAPVAAEPAPAPAAEAPAALATGDCAFNLEGNDAMAFNTKEIVVPASCSEFSINLIHTGSMPVAAMGHNVVITTTANIMDVNNAGAGAGAAGNYVPAGDDRVIAASKLIGGGESTTMTFDVSKIQDGGPYSFFCSFPGHATMMQGTIRVG